ncbi:hypothetical protein [Sanguibacter sp. 25GB23B1]|uniref:hypothetical protein n=1 Tax=unclassified Sanguibacter TaxID=2645534 RepID=UPI0032AE9C8F
MRHLLALVALQLVAIALLQRELGLDTTHVVMLTLSVVALTLVTHAARTSTTAAPHPRWPRDRRDRRPGSRDEVASLAWTFFGRDDIVSAQALRTIRTIAATRLRAHGADLHDPDDAPTCRALLGDETHRILDPTSPSTAPRPSVTELARIITVLENLAPHHAPPPTAPRTPPRTRTTP